MTAGDLMTPAEAAAMLRISDRALRGRAERGTIPCILLPSGHRRYRRPDVEALKATRRGRAAVVSLAALAGRVEASRLPGEPVAVAVRRLLEASPELAPEESAS